jgi:hypothetical protein
MVAIQRKQLHPRFHCASAQSSEAGMVTQPDAAVFGGHGGSKAGIGKVESTKSEAEMLKC